MINFKKNFKYLIPNFVFIISFFLLSYLQLNIGMIILLIIYIIFMCCIDEKSVITNQLVLLILLNVVYDMIWRKTYVQVPLELKYLVDFMSLIVLYKILLKYKEYKLVFKDKLIILAIIFIIFSAVVSFSEGIPLYTYIMCLRLYIRFIPIYIVLSSSALKYDKFDFYLLVISNLILIPIQSKISTVDDVTGIFGISNGQTLLLFLIIVTAIIVTLYSMKKISIIKFLFGIITVFIICGIGEMKISLVVIPAVIIITVMLNSKNIIKIGIAIFCSIIMVNIGLGIIIKVSPEFAEFFDANNLKQNIINYTMKPNNSEYYLGRLENIVYTDKYILTSKSDKFFGFGVGSSMPPEDYYFKAVERNKGRERFELYSTKLYEEYGPNFGYHLSSMNLIYLENGYVGLFFYSLIIVLVVIRSFKYLYKSEDIIDKCIANATICMAISLIGLMFYYNYILNRSSTILFIIVIALNMNRVRNSLDYK